MTFGGSFSGTSALATVDGYGHSFPLVNFKDEFFFGRDYQNFTSIFDLNVMASSFDNEQAKTWNLTFGVFSEFVESYSSRIVGAVQTNFEEGDLGTESWQVSVSSGGGNLTITVTGETGKIIFWRYFYRNFLDQTPQS